MNNSTSPLLHESAPGHPNTAVVLHITQFFYILTILVGSVGNIAVIISVTNNKRRIAKDYLILHLSVADLLLIFINVPLRFYHSLGYHFPPVLIIIFVKFASPLMPFTAFLSVYTLVFIAFERHQTILHPLHERMSGVKVMVILATVWVFSALCVMPIIWVGRFDGRQYSEEWPSEHYRTSYTLGFFAFQYAIPLVVITFLYLRIALFLNHQKHLRRELTLQQKSSSMDLQRQQNIRVFKMFLVIILVFALFHLPNHVVWLTTEFSSHTFQSLAFYIWVMIADILITLNSCTNPVIYGLAGLLKLRCFGCLHAGSKNNSTNSVARTTGFTRLSPVTSGVAMEDIQMKRSNGTMVSFASSNRDD